MRDTNRMPVSRRFVLCPSKNAIFSMCFTRSEVNKNEILIVSGCTMSRDKAIMYTCIRNNTFLIVGPDAF